MLEEVVLKTTGEGPTVYDVELSLFVVAHGATQSASGVAVTGVEVDIRIFLCDI